MSVQTGEDNQDSEAQTEPITTEERWVQWPPEDLRGWGKGGEPCDDEDEEAAAFLSHSGMEGEGALKLISFLKKAGHVSSVATHVPCVPHVLLIPYSRNIAGIKFGGF